MQFSVHIYSVRMGKIKNMLMEKRPSWNERRIPHGGSSKMFSVTLEISLNADKYNLKNSKLFIGENISTEISF